MQRLTFVAGVALVVLPIAAVAQESARTVQYHSQDIVPIRAKVKYTTLIVVPATEKIMEAATGDKDYWIVDVVGNFCFVHPAKPGISSNLNLITDKGNIYSFTLQDVSASTGEPDLKVIVEPADRSALVASTGPPQFVPAVQLAQSQQQLAALQSHMTQVSTRALTRRNSNSTTPSRRMRLRSIFNRSITMTNSPISRPLRQRSFPFTR
jgi:type IV secretion system protein VirB9